MSETGKILESIIPGSRKISVLWLILALSATALGDFSAEKEKVLALAGLTNAPVIRSADGDVTSVGAGTLKTIFYDALPYEGNPTRVFAWIGIPEGASPANKVPGVVLVHGGGGTAYKAWVEKWTTCGVAAISIAVEGQTDTKRDTKDKNNRWEHHAWPGPRRQDIYGDSDRPLEDQWMYHAVADTILANSLLRSLPEVDAERVGVAGISWGGVITSTVIGIDPRFAFAIPIYGCGNLAEAENQYGRALGTNELYKQVWDPMVRIGEVNTPTLWLSWPEDPHFPMNQQAACYRAAKGPRMVSLIPGMRHSHSAGWNPPDSYAFANSIVKTGRPWSKQTASSLDGDVFTARFETSKPLNEALLISTTDSGVTGDRSWQQSPAKLEKSGDEWIVTATLPDGTTAWFVNVKSGDLTLSSDYEQKK